MWQPIETAPKKNFEIILVSDGSDVYAAQWCDNWYGDESEPGWMIAYNDEEYGEYIKATHWQPLPEPPK